MPDKTIEEQLALLQAVAKAVDFETETGDWGPLVLAMVRAGYPCTVKETQCLNG